MGVIRVQKNSNYVVMSKVGLHDDRLSWKAKGLLAYMLSMPDDWIFYNEELMKHSPDGSSTFKAAMKELREYGYVVRRKKQDEKGRFVGWETIVYEHPVENEEDNRQIENRQSKNRPSENDQLLNNKELNNKQLNNKEKVVVVAEQVYQFYQANFGVLNPFIAESIEHWINDVGAGLVIEAMKRALKQQKKWNYAEGILQDWVRNNIRTIADVEAYETEWKNRKRGRQRAIDQPGTPTSSETESNVREAIERRKRIAESTLDSEDNSSF
jgi:DnaD/phage-associated family protein